MYGAQTSCSLFNLIANIRRDTQKHERIRHVNAKLYPVKTDTEITEAIEAARKALNAHETIVMPTDTVYGIACDAFSHQGVSKLLSDKGRSRTMPPPVLIFDLAALAGVADEIPDDVYELGNKFWPGALTIILYAYPSLNWDLGETQGTVAVRVPDDKFALKLLTEHGPLAVSSANKTGQPAAVDAEEALTQLGEDVTLVVDDGRRPMPHEDGSISESKPSTILDCTSTPYVVVREGAISVDELREVVPSIVTRAELDERSEEQESAASAPEDTEQKPTGQEDLDEAYDQWDAEHAVSGEEPKRASSPMAGSIADMLVGAVNTASSLASEKPAVDQKRSRGYRNNTPQPVKTAQTPVKPVSADAARALVYSDVAQDSKAVAADSAE